MSHYRSQRESYLVGLGPCSWRTLSMVALCAVLTVNALLVPAMVFAQPPAAEDATDGEPMEPEEQSDPIFNLEDMQVPSVDECLNGIGRDWVILTTDKVYVVESIVPRPNTLDRRKRLLEQKLDERRTVSAENRDKLIQEIDDLQYLYVSLPNASGNPERRLPIRVIKEIVHHEDLMLRRLNLLLDEQNIELALELLNRLERTWEAWPGVDAAHNRLLMVDGEYRIGQQNYEGALAVLRELYARSKNYPQLSQRYGHAIDQLVAAALAQQDYQRAFFYLDDLTGRFTDHPVFQKYDAQLSQQVRELIAQATAAAGQGDHRAATMLVEEGARVWPRTAELAPAYRQYAERFQRLHVGVVDRPGAGQAFFLPTPADVRKRSLNLLPLFELNRMRDGTAYYRTRFFDEWEPYDLGRRMKFTLRQFRQPSDLHNVITVADVVTPLLRRLEPTHPDNDERLASYIDSISVLSPLEFMIEFRRVPPRVEPLLSGVLLKANQQLAAEAEDASDPTLIGPLSNPGGFDESAVPAGQFGMERTLPEPDGLPLFHVAELVEHQYENHEDAIQGLMRGDVSMLVDLPDLLVRRMQEDEGFLQQFEVQQLDLPRTQVIQFNPQSKPLRVRELRRGLAYAVDRQRMLKDFVLQDEQMRHGRIVTGPFPSNSPARHVLVKERRYDLSSAIAMKVAAMKVLKGDIPKLRFVVEPGPIQMATATEMARIWNRIGIPVEVIEGTQPAPEDWDMMFRSIQLVEPIVQIWPFLTISERAQLSDLDHYPDWLKQELVELDRTSDQSRAMTKMQELHRHLWDDAANIPLWELDQFRVVRKTIVGFPPRAMHCYDGIEQWVCQPWYAGGQP
ncbi:MAG: hypothetical protein KDA58_04585 [Planctomycetaceae bacterium]|nr:hypothetical protein [Planctomycetaceae bacterium]